ncbi:MAG: hypothetical protein A2293_06435 [Elusimicrobia bacterium RIFOXYB2_FULL_49_7]|nr:MAG: hypothetical protein A2293_06435 [Elusimicrobia bacterium RIFOXYB2_FULL_49_7]
MFLFAYPDYLQDYNRPDEKWFKAETDHFRVFYLNGLRDQAEYAVSVAEEVYGSLTAYYRMEPKDKVDLIVYDEDYSNGWAAWMLNTFKIWIADMDYPLRGTHHWIRDVVTHELAHIISMQAGQKTRYNLLDIRFGYFDYFNEKNQVNAFSVYSFDVFPNWLAEGIAQNESAKKGHDAWDAQRDMIMRMKVLNDKVLPLEQMDFFIGRSLEYESGPYNQGFSMVRYLDLKYGPEALPRLVKACAKPTTLTYGMAVQNAFGLSKQELYDNWKASEKEKYEAQRVALGTLVQGRRLVADSTVNIGDHNYYPVFGKEDKKLYFISNAGKDGFRGHLSSWDFCDTIKEEKKRFKMVAPQVTSDFSLSGDEQYVTYSRPDFDPINGESYTDAFSDSVIADESILNSLKLGLAPNRRENGKIVDRISKRLTFHDHVLGIATSHDNHRAVIIKKVQNRNSLYLVENHNISSLPWWNRLSQFALDFRKEKGTSYAEKILFQPDSNTAEGFFISTPRFSPNDSLIVFSTFDGQSRNIALVDTVGHFTCLLNSPADERDPVFSPDGRFVVFSSDQTGIFNLYQLELATGKVELLTNVLGGAFSPTVSHDGTRIAYVNYDTAGFSIYLLDRQPVKEVSFNFGQTPLPPLKTEWDFEGNRKPYFPIFKRLLFSPMVVGEELTADNAAASKGKFGLKAGGLLTLMDPLEKNTLYLIALMEVDKGFDWMGGQYGKHLFFNPHYDKDLMLLYESHVFYPTFSLEVDKFLIHQEDEFYNTVNERNEPNRYVIDVQRYSASARIPFFSPLRKLQAGLRYSKQNADFYDLDPNYALEYTFFKEWNPYLMLTHLNMAGAKGGWRQEDNIDTRGTYFKLKLDRFYSSIQPDGSSWQDAFEIGDNGVLRPKFSESTHNRLTLDLRHARALPLLPLLTVGGEVRVSAANKPIDAFLYPGIFMKSYPFLLDRANLKFLGRNTARAEANFRFPIARRLRTGLGPLLFDKIYGMAFLEAGLTSGLDPQENGRQDLDGFYRKGRMVDKYMARMETASGANRSRVYFNTEQQMDSAIVAYSTSRNNFTFDPLDKHVIYSALPEDTVQGFAENLATLWDAPARVGFGLELRLENYIAPGYPFFMTFRYSQAMDQADWGDSFKRYFTSSPINNPNGFFYFNLGFSFDGWDLIDMPDYHHPG